MKSFLFVMSKSPCEGSQVQEFLDIVLTMAAFDQKVGLLFLDDGVFQLKNGQRPEILGLKDTASIFRALEIYDVRELYAEVESLQERGLKPGDLFLPVREVYRKEVGRLMHRHKIVFGS
ncbi:MAG: sulfurtransferase complex subunit TusC [Gammaproteobacteria bacterium]